jgi:hypothetical protein
VEFGGVLNRGGSDDGGARQWGQGLEVRLSFRLHCSIGIGQWWSGIMGSLTWRLMTAMVHELEIGSSVVQHSELVVLVRA